MHKIILWFPSPPCKKNLSSLCNFVFSRIDPGTVVDFISINKISCWKKGNFCTNLCHSHRINYQVLKILNSRMQMLYPGTDSNYLMYYTWLDRKGLNRPWLYILFCGNCLKAADNSRNRKIHKDSIVYILNQIEK